MGPPILDASDPRALRQAAAAVHRGELIVFPTDTVYGIGAGIDHAAGLAALFRAKARPKRLALPILVPTVEQATSVGRLEDSSLWLARAFWPGPLTIVVTRAEGLVADLGGDGETVGLRMPDHPAALALLAETGPLATSSANRSGEPTPRTVEAVAALFGPAVALCLDGGPSTEELGSTVVRVEGASIEILRRGALGEDRIRAALPAGG
ncbi:MAG: L-threonylcarbamoyladenylate synthase [Actinomycetota bacterium]